MNALEHLQKQQQMQQFQQQLQQQQMHQQQFQQQQQQQQQLQQHIETHKTLLPTETPSLPDHNVSPKQFFRPNGQQEIILHQQQVNFFMVLQAKIIFKNKTYIKFLFSNNL